jgi:hypothetical protein
VSGISVEGALELADAWDAAEARADDELRPVVSKGALNIKKQTAATWAGHRHAPDLGRSVTYDDPAVEGESIVTEIGPDKDRRQGPLGTIYEYGTPNNAPRPALNPALDTEAPKFEQAAGDAAEKLADV